MATLHPFSPIHHWLERHTREILASTWVFGALYAYIPFDNTAAKPFQLNNMTYYECSYDIGLSNLKRRIFMTSNFVLTFLLPMLVLIFAYSSIMRKLLNDQHRVKHNFVKSVSSSEQNSTPKRLTKQMSCNPADCDTANVDGLPNEINNNLSTSSINLRKSAPINYRSKVGSE